MSDRLSVKCPECGAENFYDKPQVIRCVSCCFDEPIPAVTEEVVVGVEEFPVEKTVIVMETREVKEIRVVKEAYTELRGCVFSVGADGVAARVK